MQAANDETPVRRTASIGLGAAEHLRYIRNTIEAAQTFTTIPGR